MKGPELKNISIFEVQTIRFNPIEYSWSWNKNNNLIGVNSKGENKFTWQPHGSQFTIHEDVPDYAINIEIDKPKEISSEKILETIGFDRNHYRVVPREK